MGWHRKVGLLAALLAPAAYAADTDPKLQEQVERLQNEVRQLSEQVESLQPENANIGESNEVNESSLVDLRDDKQSYIDGDGASHTLSKPWWRNFDFSGFAAVGYYDTGSAGTRDNGSFEIKEASLFITTEVWENTEFFLEFQTNRLGSDDAKFTRTGEVYVHFTDLALTDDVSIGVKIGRIDIPFGEEYLWQDAIDNPLITNSASYPYGWDEGVLVYGELKGFNWIAAITDGTDARSADDSSDKAINLKFYGRPIESLDVSLSLMTNGDTNESGIEFGGSHFQPVGSEYPSSLGVSTSPQVNAHLFELNARYEFADNGNGPYVAVSFGAAQTDDDDAAFERDFRWFSIEPSIRLSNDWYALVRYSEIGTYDRNEGHHFDGKTFAGGNGTLGFDTRRFRRVSIGAGWLPNPRIRVKLEFAKDDFELIDASTFTPNNGDRGFVGLEVAVGF